MFFALDICFSIARSGQVISGLLRGIVGQPFPQYLLNLVISTPPTLTRSGE